MVVNTVLTSPHHAHLFTPAELAQHALLLSLPSPARRLYIRLRQRRAGWFRLSRLEYAEIPDVVSAADELARAGFAHGQERMGMYGGARERVWVCLCMRVCACVHMRVYVYI